MIKNLLGGLAGAVALNIIHETYKRFDEKAPRVDLVGEEAVNAILENTDNTTLKGAPLYSVALAGDILSNTAYFSLIGIGRKQNIMLRGALLGAVAGVGALTLTKPLGLNDAPMTRSSRTKALTVAWYVLGGVITSSFISSMQK